MKKPAKSAKMRLVHKQEKASRRPDRPKGQERQSAPQKKEGKKPKRLPLPVRFYAD